MQKLKDSERRYRRLFENAQDGILILDAGTGMIKDVNPFLIKMLGYSHKEFEKKRLWEVGAFKDIEASKNAFEALLENEYIRYEDLPLKSKDGRLIPVEFVSNVYQVDDEKVIQCNIRDVTDNRKILAALQENEKKYYDLVNQSPEGVFIIELSGNILTVNKAMCKELEFSEEEFLSMSIWNIIPKQYLNQYRNSLTKILEGKSLGEAGEYVVCGKDGKIHYVEILSTPHYSGKSIIGFQGIARDITKYKLAEETLRTSEARFKTIFEQAPFGIALIGSLTGHIYEVNSRFAEIAGRSLEEMANLDWMQITHPDDVQADLDKMALLNAEKIDGFQMEKRYLHPDGSIVWINMRIARLKVEDKTDPRHLCMIEDITDRKRVEKLVLRQLEHLSALSAIDRVIAANYDLKNCLSEILTHVTIELGIDAADILILNSNSLMLEFGAESGFHTKVVKKAQVRLGESYAGRVALEHQLIQISNLKEEPDNILLTTLLKDEDFVCYFGVPLITKGQVKGVLEVFNRTPLEPDAEWIEFLNALAGQTAIAIENTALFDSLQRSNSELALAYDATIEGWSHALDLRDKETEGHTQRVTEMTVKLARALGLSEAELVQVRWGALLHDIGKMGVPDRILLKPGPLTDEEWVAMKKHPTFAYEMLSPIRYLRLALDIPYCHHEKWDGTGYPQGLKDIQIPLAARIFAVVDVWDALSSDRPYRPAWSEDKVLEHILSLSGSHFDPQVVDVFMQILK